MLPKQSIVVFMEEFGIKSVGWVTVELAVVVQFLLSVMVTVYIPAPRPVLPDVVMPPPQL